MADGLRALFSGLRARGLRPARKDDRRPCDRLRNGRQLYECHSAYTVLRGATARAEFHETESDMYVVHRGRATLVIGAELIDADGLPRKQQRGSCIRGGSCSSSLPLDRHRAHPGCGASPARHHPGRAVPVRAGAVRGGAAAVRSHRGRARLRSGASCAVSSWHSTWQKAGRRAIRVAARTGVTRVEQGVRSWELLSTSKHEAISSEPSAKPSTPETSVPS